MVEPPKRFEQTIPGVGSRRIHARVKIPVEVMVIPLDGQEEPFWATSEDLSSRGLFITGRRQPPIDQVLMLKIVLPEALVGRQRRPVRVKARVVHALPGVGFGCKFVEMTEHASDVINTIMACAAAAPHRARTVH